MQDEKILLGIRNRKEDVMAKVVGQYSRLLWPIAAAILEGPGDERDVEECIADTFIYLWQNPEKFSPERGSLKTMLCIITRSRAIDRRRVLLRHQTVPLDDMTMWHKIGMQEEFLANETRRELIAAVKALEEPGREILVRRYYYEQKPKEIALALGLTVKQVDNNLYRAKRQLRQTLVR